MLKLVTTGNRQGAPSGILDQYGAVEENNWLTILMSLPSDLIGASRPPVESSSYGLWSKPCRPTRSPGMMSKKGSRPRNFIVSRLIRIRTISKIVA